MTSQRRAYTQSQSSSLKSGNPRRGGTSPKKTGKIKKNLDMDEDWDKEEKKGKRGDMEGKTGERGEEKKGRDKKEGDFEEWYDKQQENMEEKWEDKKEDWKDDDDWYEEDWEEWEDGSIAYAEDFWGMEEEMRAGFRDYFDYAIEGNSWDFTRDSKCQRGCND